MPDLGSIIRLKSVITNKLPRSLKLKQSVIGDYKPVYIAGVCVCPRRNWAVPGFLRISFQCITGYSALAERENLNSNRMICLYHLYL